ncbi:shikimate 5-dehydrogenase [Lichenicola cladoniae]|uniref:Shikimate 5-dehydrogenase n=1 Tax=Lichenicola cladoniae TaxID=1484109 RepID=A0A6M8HNP7_9PROT|nr:shikimate 5-dehydrogenase [Lichenicola cladoniae]NPD68489.1 shikimate 5-dehydrogenase [Acetobacteraceae bacterium]QKE90034.1 shikimate 5-dehydrogenase [Lichenicola cladoniae]
MRTISKDTRLCMSLSARPGNFGTRFQNHLYQAMELDFIYKAFTTTDLPGAVGGIRALGIRGCAISMPFKEACIPMLDGLDPSAAAIGSVNTIVNDDGVLRGFNTDYIAIDRLIDRHALSAGSTLLLRGSGGMGKAVASAFRDRGFANGTIVSRNESAGRVLAESCGWEWQAEPEGLQADLLVNVTPLGMAGGAEADTLAFPESVIQTTTIVFDVVAAPVETPLIRAARRLDIPVITGDAVMVLQGVEQFVLYTGVRPTDAQLQAASKAALR